MNDRFTNNDNDDDTIRNDKIYWVGETNKDDKDDPLLQAIRILRSIPYELNMKHGVPMICQLSCFDKGGKYVAHRDVPQVMNTRYTLSNLLLYMLSIVNTREITIVLYLNSLDWDSTNDTGNNNGNLRLYVDAHHNDTKGSTSTKIIDVPPKGGRVIIFNRFTFIISSLLLLLLMTIILILILLLALSYYMKCFHLKINV
jgi:hypothetical protein